MAYVLGLCLCKANDRGIIEGVAVRFWVMTSVPSVSPAMPDAQTVNLAEVLLDQGTQSRLGGNDPVTVKRYAEDMAGGLWDFARRPLPVLFFDGDCYYPGDGHHRITAARQCNLTELLCEVRPGDQREALFYSNTEANKFHGKQLTRKDKRNRVRNLLLDEEWALMSDREIARHCGVSAPFVGGIRRDMIEEKQIVDSTKRKGKDGKVRDTANIGKISPAPVGANAGAVGDGAVGGGAEDGTHVVDATLYEALLQERDDLQNRLMEQQRLQKLKLAQVTEASQADELKQALADDEALMQQIYDGLGTIAGALEGDLEEPELLRVAVLQAGQGIGLMRRILEAKAPNLIVEEEDDEEGEWEE